MKKDTVGYLKKFIEKVEKKYGKEALKFRVEVHSEYKVGLDEYVAPNELSFVGIAKYKEDKINEYPEELVMVIR